jgi:gliding motility-associated-like protein
MRRTLYFVIIFFFPVVAYSQFCGMEMDSSFINGRRSFIPIEVTSFVNNDLSNPDQGLCEVRLHFRHINVKTLEVWVVSPNNDSIQLIGPLINNPGISFNTPVFNIAFTRCDGTADPDNFQTPQWSNNNNFDIFNSYEGTYFPSSGCLEDFNSGPVNGQWKIVYESNYASFFPGDTLISSRIFDVELIFCDDEGNPCCDANAGTFDDVPITACEGDPALIVMPEPVYAGAEPDPTKYGFTYLIFQNGILDSLTDTPDLTGYEGGFYEVCGLSYRLSDSLNLPDPADNISLTDLRSDLASNSASICADITTNCLEITIVGPSETFLNETICAGETFTIGSNIYDTNGTFRDTLQNVIGCDSFIILNLAIIDTLRENIEATICTGDSYAFGGELLTIAGTYSDTLTSTGGCDSIAFLNLMVEDVLIMDSTATICQGAIFTIGDSTFSSAGLYNVPFQTASGCDSIVRLDLQVLNPQVVFAEADTISCDNPLVTLDGSASTPLTQVGFTWLNEAEVVIGNAPTVEVDEGGVYYLVITQSVGSAFCTNRDTIQVPADTIRPFSDAGPPDTLTCLQPQAIVGTFNSSQESDVEYEWTTFDGNIVLGANQIQALVDAPGTYTLLVRKTSNGCTDASSVAVAIDADTPSAIIADPPDLDCLTDSITLDASGSSAGSALIYRWTSALGNPISDSTSLQPTVYAPGTYQLIVTDTISGCGDTAQVVVVENLDGPVVQITPVTDTLSCELEQIILDASGSDSGPGFAFQWRALDGGRIVAGAGTLRPTVDTAGLYRLVVQDLLSGCADSAEVEVIERLNTVMSAITKSNDFTCTLNTATLDARGATPTTGVTYLWSTLDGNILGPTDTDAIEVDQIGTYQLVVSDISSACRDSVIMMVVYDTLPPIAEAGPGFELNCTISEASLNSAGSSFGPEFDYAWTGPCIVSGENTGAPVVNCGGTYILTVTDISNGCTAVDSVLILENTTPPVTSAGPDTVINCLNTSLRLDGTASASGAGINYQWSGPGFLDGENTRTPLVNQSGTYVLDIVNTTTGCANSDTVNVSVDTLQPFASAGIDLEVDCSNPIATLGGSASSTGPDIRYEWTAIEGRITGPLDSIFTFTDSAGTFQLKVINQRNFCADSALVTTTFDQTFPTADAGPDQELSCLSETALLGIVVSEPGVVYSWQGPACFTGADDTPQVEVDCGGTYILEARNLNNGCVATDTVAVVDNVVIPMADLPDTVFISCENGTALLDASASSGGQFTWFRENTFIAQDTNQVLVRDPGQYTLLVTDTLYGCADSARVEVLLDCSVTAAVAPPQTLTCERELIILDASGSVPGTDSVRYEWRGPSSACILEGRDSVIAEVACAGEYIVFVTNLAVGITDSQTILVDIDTISPLADAGPGFLLTCDEPSAVLDASASSPSVGTTFLWYTFEDDTLSNTLTTTVDSAGIYIFEITRLSNGCTSTDAVEVLEDKTVPDITFGDAVFPCDPDTLRLEAFLDPAVGDYSWTWSGPSVLGNQDSLAVIIGREGTYTLEVENNENGCVIQNSVTVPAEPCPPCVEVAEPGTISCDVPVVNLSASLCEACTNCTFAWTTNNGNIVSGGNTATPQVDAPGLYTLVVSNNDNGLSTTVRIAVPADTLTPQVAVGPDRNITCANPEWALTGAVTPDTFNYTYRWFEVSNSAGTLSTAADLLVDQTGMYVLEVTNTQNGCVGTDEVTIGEDLVVPVSEAGSDMVITCDETFARLEGENSTSGPEFSYEWTAGPGGNIQTGGNSANPIVNTAAIYFLTITNTINGCTAIDSVVVSENTAPPVIQPIADQSINCIQSSVLLQGNTPNGGNFLTQWCLLNEMGDTVFCQNTLDLQVDNPGTYSFTVENDDSGCTAETTVTVVADTSAPIPDAGASEELNCAVTSLTLESFLLSGEANVDIQWSAQNGSSIADADSLRPTISSPDLYFLQISNPDNGCVGVDSVRITLDDRLPTLSIDPPAELSCENTDIRLNSTATTATNRLGALWSTTDGQFIGSFDVLNPRVRAPGTYTLTITDLGNGCESQASVVVTQDLRAPSLQIDTLDGTIITCDNEFIDFSFDGSTSATGQGLDFINRLNGVALPDNQPLSGSDVPGNFEIIGVDQGNGCRDTVRFQIRQNTEAPLLEMRPADDLRCNRSAVILSAGNSARGPQFRYNWTGSGLILATADPLEVEVTQAGTYQLEIRDTINGCIRTESVEVELDTISPTVNIGEPQLLDCQDVLFELDGSIPGANGGLTYEWSTVLGGNIVSGANSPIARVDSAGVYQLRITDTRNGCSGTGSITVENNAQPIENVEFTIIPPDCRGDGTGALEIGAVTGGVGPFSFALDSDVFLTQNFFRNLTPDTTHVLKIMDSRGCMIEYSFSFPDVTPLEVELGPDQNIDLGDSIRIEALVNRGYDSLRWAPVGQSGDPTLATQVLKPLETTVYSVIVQDSLGCTARESVVITVNTPESLFFPTAFSPDGNGLNDIYYIFADDDVRQIRAFYIFDRWGTLVFEQENFQPNDPNFGWDGKFRGKQMKPAVFVFSAEVEYIDGRVELVKGDFALLNK